MNRRFNAGRARRPAGRNVVRIRRVDAIGRTAGNVVERLRHDFINRHVVNRLQARVPRRNRQEFLAARIAGVIEARRHHQIRRRKHDIRIFGVTLARRRHVQAGQAEFHLIGRQLAAVNIRR